MKVKVTPPYEGAGSWTTDCVWVAGKWRDEETLAEYPASWCEKIPEVVPQEGDICEFWDDLDTAVNKTEHFIGIFVAKEKHRYRSTNYGDISNWDNCRVLARKPKGFDSDIRDAIENLKTDFYSAETYTQEKAAYERFLSAILGVPYGRVDK